MSEWLIGAASRRQILNTTLSEMNLLLMRISFQKAVECFFSDFEIRSNKRYRDRYQLIGKTIGGRTLKIIFQLKSDSVVRIITG